MDTEEKIKSLEAERQLLESQLKGSVLSDAKKQDMSKLSISTPNLVISSPISTKSRLDSVMVSYYLILPSFCLYDGILYEMEQINRSQEM